MQNDLQNQIDSLTQQVQILTQQLREHNHNGVVGQQIYFKSIFGLFETVSTFPSTIPKTTYDCIKIYTNGATLRLYWYDSVANLWHYVTATA